MSAKPSVSGVVAQQELETLIGNLRQIQDQVKRTFQHVVQSPSIEATKSLKTEGFKHHVRDTVVHIQAYDKCYQANKPWLEALASGQPADSVMAKLPLGGTDKNIQPSVISSDLANGEELRKAIDTIDGRGAGCSTLAPPILAQYTLATMGSGALPEDNAPVFPSGVAVSEQADEHYTACVDWVQRQQERGPWRTLGVDFRLVSSPVDYPRLVFQVTLGSTMRVYIAGHLASSQNSTFDPARITVTHATAVGERERLESTNLTASQYAVFQNLSTIITAQLTQFSMDYPGNCLVRLVMWLANYTTLFTQPCCHCQKVLAIDNTVLQLLPPILRIPADSSLPNFPMKYTLDTSFKAFHRQCYQLNETSSPV
ncbi:Mediator of RNA polymerase II transcription subunit 27 [Dispira parvispora]|uniref:Mediator of RNA polymerase II transcription subunit 27 n=1 Tax=Dispira parvispora TaxID=1520584 RepID=A0A9W8AR56_9FUNG|nr:Mediator of RNA polymerase II transcription subunit 27 [Dispira parvispora]